jgi:hypothetical protein
MASSRRRSIRLRGNGRAVKLPRMRHLWIALALALGLAACATLSTAGMTPACRQMYNACLNGCPQPNPNMPADAAMPACVDECNRQAKACQ